MLDWFAAMTVRKWSVLVTTNVGLVCSHDCKEMERSSYHKCWGWFAAMTVRKWSVLVTTNVGAGLQP